MIRSSVLLFASALAATTLFPASAKTQDNDNARYDATRTSNWTYELGAATDNRSKGASKSANDPYVFGEVQWNAANGFYADLEFETIDSSGSYVETEAEAGWQYSFLGFDFDTSASHKWRVGAVAGHDDAAWEYQFDIIKDFGDLDTRLRVEHSPDGLGSTRAWTWVEGRIRFPLTRRLKASATLGRREQENSPDYTGWNVGAAYALSDTTSFDLRWHGADASNHGEQYEDALVAGILIAF